MNSRPPLRRNSQLETFKSYILIVEDDAGIRDGLLEAIDFHGYQASAVSDGQEALDFLEKVTRLPALILLDLMMPVMNGWQFLEKKSKIPELHPVPVLVTSAAEKKNLSPDQVIGFLKKPVDLDELFAWLDMYCTPN